MKRWPQLLFLDFFTLIAIIALIAVYVFGVDVGPRRIAISWIIVGGQLVVNAGYLIFKKEEQPGEEAVEQLTQQDGAPERRLG